MIIQRIFSCLSDIDLIVKLYILKDLFRSKKFCQYCGEVRDFKAFKKELRLKYSWKKIFQGFRTEIFICNVCKLNSIPNFLTDYPNYRNKSMKEIGLKEVDVKNIIRGNETRSYEYWANWTMKRKDIRMKNLMEEITTESNIDIIKLEKILTNPSHNEHINLLCFIEKDNPKKYYVSGDGHRRVSLAHLFKIKKVMAEIIEVYYH